MVWLYGVAALVVCLASDSLADGVALQGLHIEVLAKVDSAKAVSGRGINPRFSYITDVTSEGKMRILKFITPYGPHSPDIIAAAVLLEDRDAKWQEVLLEGWDPANGGLEDPQMAEDPKGGVVIAWEGVEKGKDVSKSRLLAKWRVEDGNWSAPVVLTDEAATDISSFSLVSSGFPQVDVVWTDGRERHFTTWSHPSEDGYDKVFTRSVSDGHIGPVLRVTRKEGKYVTRNVKARMDQNGKMYVVWNQEKRNDYSQIRLSARGETWLTKNYDVSEVAKTHVFYEIAPLPDGSAYIFWVKPGTSENLCYRRFFSGELSPIGTLSTKACCPSVAVSADGAVHVLYQEEYPWDNPTAYHKGHLYYQRLQSGVWSERQEIGDSVFFGTARIAIDQSNRIHLFWQQFEDGTASLIHAVAIMSPTRSLDKIAPE